MINFLLPSGYKLILVREGYCLWKEASSLKYLEKIVFSAVAKKVGIG